MASKANKALKKNIILIGIVLFNTLGAIIIYKRYFSQSSSETGNLDVAANIEENITGSDESSAVSLAKDINSSIDFFKRESFLSLREYVNKEITIQKEIVATTDDFPPPPQDVVIDDPGAGKKLNIFWDKAESDKVDKIRIYRFEDSEGNGIMIAELDKTENTFADNNLVNDKIYYYLVKAVNKQGQMSKNIEKYSGTPRNVIAPGRLLEFSFSQTKDGVEFLWQNSSDEDLEYVNIYKSQTTSELGPLFAKLKAVPSQKQKWTDTDIVPYEEYYYTFLTVDAAGNTSPYYTIKLGNKNIFVTSEGGGE